MVTAQEAFDHMVKTFNKEEAMKLEEKVVVQYDILGDGGGSWQIVLENGEYELIPGDSIKDVSCSMIYDSVENFFNILTGEISGTKAFISGKLKVKGSKKLLKEIGKVFPPNKK